MTNRRNLAVITVGLVLTAPAFAAPDWWVALHGPYLTADELAQVTFPQAPASSPVPDSSRATDASQAPVALTQEIVAPVGQTAVSAIAATSRIAYLPQWYGSMGGGGTVPGKAGVFVYEAIATYLGQQSYATLVNEYTISQGKALSCTMAGVSKALYGFGPITIGTTGLGGGCSSSGSSGGAGAIQGFANFHIGKTAWSIVVTGDKTFTPIGAQAVKLTLGLSYGK